MLPEGVVNQIEDAVDRSTLAPVLKGEVLHARELASKEAGRGMAAIIPKGMRAYTIQASRVAANVAGFVMPGNRVDVLLNVRGGQDDETGGGSTTTLLQSVEILAVDQRLDSPTENHMNLKELASVTLLVTPDQAAKLDLGQSGTTDPHAQERGRPQGGDHPAGDLERHPLPSGEARGQGQPAGRGIAAAAQGARWHGNPYPPRQPSGADVDLGES